MSKSDWTAAISVVAMCGVIVAWVVTGALAAEEGKKGINDKAWISPLVENPESNPIITCFRVAADGKPGVTYLVYPYGVSYKVVGGNAGFLKIDDYDSYYWAHVDNRLEVRRVRLAECQ